MALVRTSILHCLIIFGSIIFGNSALLLCEDYCEVRHAYAVGIVNAQNVSSQNSDLFNSVIDSLQGNNSNNFEAIFDGQTINDWQMS